MPMISVCIGTYGLPYWRQLAATRAIVSVQNQTHPAHEVLHKHADTLQEARNGAAEAATGEWLCFLDADDELDRGYLAAMAAAIDRLDDGDWLLQPATLGVYADGTQDAAAVVIPHKPLIEGNYLVVSTLIRKSQFDRIGGFDDLPVYEDWDLWLRADADGVRVGRVPAAVLRVYVNPTGRNSPPPELHARVVSRIRHRAIRLRRT